MVPRYYLGIDIGTYESKGMIVDQNGRCLFNHAVAHDMESPQTGYAEHDAEKVWWGDFCRISRALIRKSGLDSRMIKGIGCSAIGPCCLPVDEDGSPLRKAILYGIDVRAAKEIDELNVRLGEAWILRKYGNPITSQSIGPKILWIKNHEPEIYRRTARFITSSTYLVARLTGRYTIDRYTAAFFTPMYDLEKQDWDYDNLAEFCRPDQLAACRWTDEIAGIVTARAAAETGLCEGTPVTTGTADAAAEAVGAGVCRPGDMLLMFGSSIFIIHMVPRLTSDLRFWTGPFLFQDTCMVASGMSSAGTLTRWFRDQLAPDLLAQEKQSGVNAYDLLMQEIGSIPAGSGGLVVLPYFSGERTPVNDPAARGVFFGLTLQHTRAHLYQACLEGVGYGIAQHLEGYREIGMETRRIIAVGGGTRTAKWMQIVADITGRELLVGETYGAAYGDAMLAALATGCFRSIEEVASHCDFKGKVLPDAGRSRDYEPFKRVYSSLYRQTRELMHTLSNNAEGSK